MSPRVTRSSNKQPNQASDYPAPSLPPQPPSRKRKAAARTASPGDSSSPPPKRKAKEKAVATMSESKNTPPEPMDDATPAPQTSSSSTKRKSSKSKKSSAAEQPTPSSAAAGKRNKSSSKSSSTRKHSSSSKKIQHSPQTKARDSTAQPGDGKAEGGSDGSRGQPSPHYDDESPDDATFELGGLLGRNAPSAGLMSHIRQLGGLGASLSGGSSSHMRSLLETIKTGDPGSQYAAMQDLSTTLLMSNEDTFAGSFSPEPFVKEFVNLMTPSDAVFENPEMTLLACQCIANLIEALPQATSTVVYSEAVPVLVSKLANLEFIDFAEHALGALERISSDFPASIVRADGLGACLNNLDFFASSTQRKAVTTAANSCRNIPSDCFESVNTVMPALLGVLNSSDQRVVEQGCLCVSRIVDSFKFEDDKIEALMSADMLRAILRLLLPGSSNLVGLHIPTQFLRVLATTAHASPKLTADLFRMNVTETLYQILTGVSPPDDKAEHAAQQIDSVMVMQALIHRPKDQVYETLNVICELLPGLDRGGLGYLDGLGNLLGAPPEMSNAKSMKTPINKRRDMLHQCKTELRRFAIIILPTLCDAYSSTVNLGVRQKVLSAQLKMLFNLDQKILEDALREVSYASYLASILSQQDHVLLVTSALQAAELLLKRLGPVYKYQFYREGVISEIRRLAERPPAPKSGQSKTEKGRSRAHAPISGSSRRAEAESSRNASGSRDNNGSSEEEGVECDDSERDEDQNMGASHHSSSDGASSSDSESSPKPPPSLMNENNIKDYITECAKKFIEAHEKDEESRRMRERASHRMETLQNLMSEVTDSYEDASDRGSVELFSELVNYFEGDALESITSYELLSANVLHTLLDVFGGENRESSEEAKTAFLQVFMGSSARTQMKTASSNSPTTPFSVLIHKLQELLSRAEPFEVSSVNSSSLDSARVSASSMLSKMIPIKLVADVPDAGIPEPFRELYVRIHAIANMKILDDYLRPRIELSERPRTSRMPGSSSRDPSTSRFLAAMASREGPEGLMRRRLAGTALTPPSAVASYLNSRPTTTTSSRTQPSQYPSGGRDGHALTNAAESSSEKKYDDPAKTSTRRSTRKTRASIGRPETPPSAPAEEDASQTADMQTGLECSDEAHFTDDEDAMEEDEAIMDEFEEEVEEDVPDPSAVNMEVAAEGQVTAREDGGERVPTPQGSSSVPRLPAPMGLPSGLSRSLPSHFGHSMSYSAAIQSTPTDWHMEFSINGQPLPSSATVYKAVTLDGDPKRVWSHANIINYKRVNGPPPRDSNVLEETSRGSPNTESGLPQSLDRNPTTAAVLKMLRTLHGMNLNLDDILNEDRTSTKIHAEPAAQFVNTKLTAKMNRQLEEPLIVASRSLPSWSEDLARLYPFLFPFETRHLFLQSTSFGYSRCINRWQNAQSTNDSRGPRHRDDRAFPARVQRQKVRISRSRLLESAIKVLDLYASNSSILEVEYFDEVGTGLGPTLEFYSNVSKEFARKKLHLWRDNETDREAEYVFGRNGLFPAPMSEQHANSDAGQKTLSLFKVLGKFVARAMLDSRMIDVAFNPAFFRIGSDQSAITPSLGVIKQVDQDLARSLQRIKQYAVAKKKIDAQAHLTAGQKSQKAALISVADAKIDDLYLDFTLPGYPDVELIPGGSNVSVNIENVGDYVDKVIDFTLNRGVIKQAEAFRSGFSHVFPYSALNAFTSDELVMLFGNFEEDWSMETLTDSVKADHGYNLDSSTVRNLLQAMSELSTAARRDFLQFVTGSPKLPIGGFKSLTPMFTVVMRPNEPGHAPDEYLPSCMTCVNYLKMPDYSSLEVMRERLGVAIREGQGAFHLS